MEEKFETVILTRQCLERYLDAIASSGRKKQTVLTYRKGMEELYEFLPESKEITLEILEEWKRHLEDCGFSKSTIHVRLATVNGFLRYSDERESAVFLEGPGSGKMVAQMQQSEYRRFLSTVLKVGTEREYLLIQVFASIGLGVVDLPYLTVEACREGVVDLPDGRRVTIHDAIGRELLQYAGRQHVTSGTIFVTRNGNPLDSSNIYRSIRNLARKIGIDPEKCCPQALNRMCCDSRDESEGSDASDDLTASDNQWDYGRIFLTVRGGAKEQDFAIDVPKRICQEDLRVV